MRYPTMIIGESSSEHRDTGKNAFSSWPLAVAKGRRARANSAFLAFKYGWFRRREDQRVGAPPKRVRPIPEGSFGSVVSDCEFPPAQTAPALPPRLGDQGAVPRDSE